MTAYTAPATAAVLVVACPLTSGCYQLAQTNAPV